jgi:hypothetical protein
MKVLAGLRQRDPQPDAAFHAFAVALHHDD